MELLLFLLLDEMSVQQDGCYCRNDDERDNYLFIPLYVADEYIDYVGEAVTDEGDDDRPDRGGDEVYEKKTAGLHVGAPEKHEDNGAKAGEEPHDKEDEMAVLVDDLVGQGCPSLKELVSAYDRPPEIFSQKEERAVSCEGSDE